MLEKINKKKKRFLKTPKDSQIRRAETLHIRWHHLRIDSHQTSSSLTTPWFWTPNHPRQSEKSLAL